MNLPCHVDQAITPRAALYCPPDAGRHTARWRVNGYGATIIVWTAEEWEGLLERPDDAQFYACGVWCALRMD